MKSIIVLALCVTTASAFIGCHSNSSGLANAPRSKQEDAFRGDPDKLAEVSAQMKKQAEESAKPAPR